MTCASTCCWNCGDGSTNGFDEATRQEIIALLVRGIRIETTFVDGKKFGVAKIEYRFPSVVDTDTGRDSARTPA